MKGIKIMWFNLLVAEKNKVKVCLCGLHKNHNLSNGVKPSTKPDLLGIKYGIVTSYSASPQQFHKQIVQHIKIISAGFIVEFIRFQSLLKRYC